MNAKTVNLLTAVGSATNNSTKANSSLQADLFGDWREEIMWRSEDSSEFRIYSTVFEIVRNGKYDVKTGTITFKTNHFSYYSSLYEASAFTDLNQALWAIDPIEALAARSIRFLIMQSRLFRKCSRQAF